jgi:2-polyprenyl-6-methoxyphenol hydroxylase-like FAD-dependent oxidoreductase
MRVLVVGAGIAGLALTTLLRAEGFDVVCVENSTKSTHVGFAIGVWENGLRILRAIGISPQGLAIDQYALLDARGRRICGYALSDLGVRPAMLHMLRKDLHDALRAKADDVRFGISIDVITPHPDWVSVTFTDGTTDEFDLIVGADGTRSRVRELVFPGIAPRSLGWRGWYFWFDTSLFSPDAGAVESWRPGMFFGAFPHGGEKTCGYLGMPFTDEDTPQARRKALDRAIAMSDGEVRKVLCSLNPADFSGHAVVELVMQNTVSGRVVLIGDAAHVMEPFAGLGASMALEDAMVLAQELRSSKDVPSALLSFVRRRQPRVSMALKQTRRFSRIVRMRSRVLGSFVALALRVIPPKWFTRGYRTLLTHDP